MIRCIVGGLAVVLLVGSAGIVFAQSGSWDEVSVEGEVIAIPLQEDLITLDGDLSDWEDLPRYKVDYGTTPSPSETAHPYFEFSAAADGDWFYYMMTTPDDVIVAGEHEDHYWDEDSVEIYLNLADSLLTTEYEPGIAQIIITAADLGNEDPETLTITGTESDTATVQGYVFETEDGWGVEIAISLADYGYVPEEGIEIGFNTGLNGATQPDGDRDVKLMWSLWDTEDSSWIDPSVFGTGVFVTIE